MEDWVDWASWSREAVEIMKAKNEAWTSRFGLGQGRFDWSADDAVIRFVREHDTVVADICFVGTTSRSEGSFLWGWANDAIPSQATRRLDLVRAFGEDHDLPLLVTAEVPGGRAEGLECAVLSARILDAEGVFVDSTGDLEYFLTLFDFRIERHW